MSPARPGTADADAFLHYPGSTLVVSLLADKWTIPVVHALARGTKRTGELRREVAGVSQKMLTQTLRSLEEHGLVERTVYPVVPPRVEYRLTAMGESLNEPLARLCEWTVQHGRALERAVARRQGRGAGRTPADAAGGR
jgi:DNA-binding HxlR family transcriptional regulator